MARRALELADPRAESHPESQVRVHLVLDGLCPEVQYRIYHRGCLIGRADLASPERRLVVEYDGVWHGAPLQVGPDRDRLNRLHAAGWEVVFITAQHLRSLVVWYIPSVRHGGPPSCVSTQRQASMSPSRAASDSDKHPCGGKETPEMWLEVVRWGLRVPGALGARSACWSRTPGRRHSTRER